MTTRYQYGGGVVPMSCIWDGQGIPVSQCIIGNGPLGTPLPQPQQNEIQTPVKTLPSPISFVGGNYI